LWAGQNKNQINATWICRPTALADFSSVDKRISTAWFSILEVSREQTMKTEYDLTKMKSRKNP